MTSPFVSHASGHKGKLCLSASDGIDGTSRENMVMLKEGSIEF
jgi:hypothetical protein